MPRLSLLPDRILRHRLPRPVASWMCLALTAAALFLPPGSAQPQYRIDRNTNTGSGQPVRANPGSPGTDSQPTGTDPEPPGSQEHSAVRSKPLTGQVDVNVIREPEKPIELKPGTGTFYGRRQVESGRLDGQVDQSARRGELDASGGNLPAGVRAQPPIPLSDRRMRLPGDLCDTELSLLSRYDVVVLQDRSSSMGTKERFPSHGDGRPVKMKRWGWCLEQALDLTRQTAYLPRPGITLAIFSSKYDLFNNVTMAQIPSIYARQGLFIGTKMVPPLEEQLELYFGRRSRGQARPLLVAVISDGHAADDKKLCRLLVDTTHRLRDPDEVSIVFLQIGYDDDGDKLLETLDNKLMKRGARFDIVSVTRYFEVIRVGLARALVDTIKSHTVGHSAPRAPSWQAQ